MTFKNSTYDKLKWVAQYLLPAAAALYFAVSKIWNIPYGSEVPATLAAIDAFLGVLLGISSANYQGEGTLTVDTSNPNTDIYHLDLNVPIDSLTELNSINLKVNSNSQE